MKTILLKLALCTFVAALPIGAWADSDRTTYSTGEETVISEATTWVFNSHTAGEIKTITSPLSDGLYVRANSSNTWTIESAVGSATFSDGTTVSYTQIASSSGANSNQGSNVYSAGYTGAGRFYCTLAINTRVAGTCYAIMSGMSEKHGRVQFTDGTSLKSEEGEFAGDGNLIEVKYTSTGAGTFFIGGKNGETDCGVKVYAVRFVPSEQTVSAATSLTFDHFATDANLNSVYNMANGFFIRGNSQKYFTVQDNTDASKPYSFSDGESLQANKYVELNGAISANAFGNDNDEDPWTTVGSATYPSIAFKNTIAGKILVYSAKNTSESKATLRYYTKSTTTTPQNLSVTTTPTEYSWDVAADEVTYITAGNAAGLRIYGVRFVPTYTLTVNAENGTVTRSPEKSKYNYNEVVTLTATPADGYKFVSWTGVDSSDGATATVTMNADKNVTATFVPKTYTLTVNAENGTVTRSPEKDAYDYNEVVTLTATPADGYKFVSWTGVDSSDGATATVTMNADKNVTATFVPKTYTLTVNAENGTVTRSSEKDAYDYNEVVTLTAIPNNGYKFVDWSTGETTASINVTMTEDKTITANFAKGAATTVWKFDQYVASAALVSSAANKAASEEYTDGLYFHTKSQTNSNHKVVTLKRTIEGRTFSSQTTIYAAGSTYMAVQIGKGGTNTVSATDASAAVACDGIAYKAPTAGTFYATFYAGSEAKVVVYQNNTESSDSTTFNKKEGKEISISVVANDVIYLVNTSSSNIIALLEASFVPTTADTVTVTKTVTLTGAGGGYATFSATQNYDLPADVSAYIVSNVSDKKATMTEINEIPACTGVILYKEGVSSDTEITLTSKETTKVDVSSNWLKANIADYILPANDGTNYNYTLAAGPVFKHVKDTGTVDERTLAAGKAFLRTTESGAGARSFELVFDDDETTGIKAIEPSQYTNDIYFNLAGQRVEKPTKGLYIVNGKKVVIK